MREKIIKFLIEDNRLVNFEVDENDVTHILEGYHFSCNYFQIQPLYDNIVRDHLFQNEGVAEIWNELLLLLEKHGYTSNDNLEETLEKIYNAYQSSFTA